MKPSTSMKLTLCLALLVSLASCSSEKDETKPPQGDQQVTQAAQPKAQDAQPKAQDAQPKAKEAQAKAKDAQPKAKEEKAKAQNGGKKWLPIAMADINLTAEQEGKLKPVVLESKKQIKAVREDATLDSAAKKEKLTTIAKATMDQTKAILTPEQWKKFLQARKALMEKNKAAAQAAPAKKES